MKQPPSAEEQIGFLQKLQRVYEEGEFTATYKFALLMSIAELTVERGNDSGDVLNLKIQSIAEKFAEFYWPQSTPYAAGTRGTYRGVLSQNLGQQAAVINKLIEFRRAHTSSLAQMRGGTAWKSLVRDIARVVRDQPVRYLQNVGGTSVRFLYEPGPATDEITLVAGAMYCLRRFQVLVHQLSRTGWVRHVRENSRNRMIVGEAGDLEAFMFGRQRANLELVRNLLVDVQSRRCFYCGRDVLDRGVVDHFIPWSKYPRDLAHNFVLTDSSCNNAKSDMLAAHAHLERWREMTHGKVGENLGKGLAAGGVIADLDCSRTVARWAYGQGLAAGAHAWVKQEATEAISEKFLDVLK